MRGLRISLGILCFLILSRDARSADVALKVDAAHPSHAVSPRLVGIFFEDINFGGDGGLAAELVKNGAFEFPNGLMGWSTVPADAAGETVNIAKGAPVSGNNPHFLRIEADCADSGLMIANEGFRGIGMHAGERYIFSAQLRASGEESGALRVSIVGANGKTLASTEIDVAGTEWSEYTAVLMPSATATKAQLVLTPLASGTLDLDLVSLCPEKTWKNRPHGLRADLVQKLADLKPAFLRFPGGCIVEGSQLDRRYQWKSTIGDRADRKLAINRWNYEFAHRPAPDYFQSFAVGFLEFFQLAEDIGAEPLPILNCGMACQFNTAELVPLNELGPYIQDALDLIEFANGPVSSKWGGKRAALGHPEPFSLRLLGVGNEQWGPQYFERYELFAKAIKERYPEIELVSSCGPFPADKNVQFAWPLLRGLKAEIVDEHCYAMPDWFLREATRFDNYDRQGPKVFMGEYAAQSIDLCAPDNRNNLRCALAEAAFLTGVERNSDVVVMSSYAPLFGHEEAWQWRPNLIWFDNLSVYATPSYYVQQLFSHHRGDVVLPLELSDSRPPRPAAGGIGLVTNGASVEFEDLQITQDGQVVFDGKSLTGPGEMTLFRGKWQVSDGVVRQWDVRAVARAHFGDPAWQNYTLTLKARKLSGGEGFGVIFRNSDGGSYLQWNLGSDMNSQHRLEAHLASHSVDDTTVDRADGALDTNRWYDLKVELNGPRVRCYVDGTLVHDQEIAPPALPRIFAVASRDESTGQTILKVVNPTDDATSVAIDLAGVGDVHPNAQAIVLAGSPNDENSIEEPDAIAPREEALPGVGAKFEHTFAPNSLTILRIDAK